MKNPKEFFLYACFNAMTALALFIQMSAALLSQVSSQLLRERYLFEQKSRSNETNE